MLALLEYYKKKRRVFTLQATFKNGGEMKNIFEIKD